MNTEELADMAQTKGYATKKRHIFLCTGGKCSTQEQSLELWEYLKNRLRELEPDTEKATVMRSKVDCLRICHAGPVALVYPEGTLYAELDEEKLERIIQEHLLNGRPVEDYLFFEKAL
jgi:(2Fe-2S) ferredoxin